MLKSHIAVLWDFKFNTIYYLISHKWGDGEYQGQLLHSCNQFNSTLFKNCQLQTWSLIPGKQHQQIKTPPSKEGKEARPAAPSFVAVFQIYLAWSWWYWWMDDCFPPTSNISLHRIIKIPSHLIHSSYLPVQNPRNPWLQTLKNTL